MYTYIDVYEHKFYHMTTRLLMQWCMPARIIHTWLQIVNHTNIYIYILLTKREGRTGRILARGLDSKDLAALGPYKKERGPIFSQYGREQAWLIKDLLHDWKKQRHKCGIIRDNARSDT